jgi:GDSL-like Lipase/Acylhydrolase
MLKSSRAIKSFFIILILTGCTQSQNIQPSISPATTPSATKISTPTKTQTAIPTPSSTSRKPLTLVFYGDSSLKVGEVGREGVGFSFVDYLPAELDSNDILITANYGGKTAKWAFENIQRAVLSYNPNVVTLEWGWDDLYGCGGIFDRDANSLIEYRLGVLLNDHIKYLKLQIDTLLEKGIFVFVVTPLPTLGDLLWSHLGPNNEVIYEEDRGCKYNMGMEKIVEAQRQLVRDYSSEQKPVFLVDAWQIYRDNPYAEKMYMDNMHPASHGAELIAEGWLRAFKESKIH